MAIVEIRKKSTEVIELLEELLDDARKGHLHELVILSRFGVDYTTYYTATENIPELIGRLEMMKNNQILRAKQ